MIADGITVGDVYHIEQGELDGPCPLNRFAETGDYIVVHIDRLEDRQVCLLRRVDGLVVKYGCDGCNYVYTEALKDRPLSYHMELVFVHTRPEEV